MLNPCTPLPSMLLCNRQMPTSDATAVCRAVLPPPSSSSVPPLLSLSVDEALLAVCSGPSVQLYSTRQLIDEGQSKPLGAALQLGSPVKQVW